MATISRFIAYSSLTFNRNFIIIMQIGHSNLEHLAAAQEYGKQGSTGTEVMINALSRKLPVDWSIIFPGLYPVAGLCTVQLFHILKMSISLLA